MLEKIIIDVCNQMAESLTTDQLTKLKDVLFMTFHNRKIIEESTSVIPTEQDPNILKIKMFVATKKVSGVADSSIGKYIQDLKQFSTIMDKPFEEITSMDIRWYLAYCRENRKNKLSTIDGIRASLSCFYAFLESEELISKNPMKKIETVKVPKEIRKAFTSTEMEAIRSACLTARDRALIELLYSTGLRASELCSLNIGDINWNRQEIYVVGKGNKERVVYISDSALFYLKRYLADRCKQEGCDFTSIGQQPLFVRLRYKDRIKNSGIQYIIREIGKRANVSDVHPHRFRRTFATDLLNRGMKVEQVMALMGHTKLDTTMVYYDITKSSISESFRRCA